VKPLERLVVGYIRVSSEEQKKSGLSIEAQEEKIKQYAGIKDLRLAKVYHDEAESGKDMNRPSMLEIMDGIQNGKIGHLVVYKLDRLTRSLADLSHLLVLFDKKEITLSSVQETIDTSTATGRLMVQMIGMFAEWERGQIVERTQVALDRKREKGEKLGGIVPYGWSVKKGMLIPNPKESGVLNGILKACREGRGYKDIADTLNDQGIKPRAGRRWYASTIRYICLRAGVQREKRRA
jgi:site-specific DNA recombinase